eukprot:SAG22_NODE_6553_length_840_cov_0.875843_1_plen_176_part_00
MASPLKPTLNFPPTGSWEEWGTVSMRADLVSGHNTIRLTATTNSGPNLDSLEVITNGDTRIGNFIGNFDNSGSFYVNNQKVVGPGGTGWDTTTHHTFTEPCDVPSVYAFHVVDGEVSEDGNTGVGGVIASITHCNEVITTSAKWKCIATDMPAGSSPDASWNEVNFDDGLWETAT